jgi:hypothetical protein
MSQQQRAGQIEGGLSAFAHGQKVAGTMRPSTQPVEKVGTQAGMAR